MMMTCETRALVVIAPGAPLMLTDAFGTRVSCTAGAAWITQTHDTRDIALDAGGCFVLDRPGTAVLSASRGATLQLEAARPQRAHAAGWVDRLVWRLQPLMPRFQ